MVAAKAAKRIGNLVVKRDHDDVRQHRGEGSALRENTIEKRKVDCSFEEWTSGRILHDLAKRPDDRQHSQREVLCGASEEV